MLTSERGLDLPGRVLRPHRADQRFPLPGKAGIGAHFTFSSTAAWIALYSSGAVTPRKLPFWTTFASGMWLIDHASTETTCGFVPSP